MPNPAPAAPDTPVEDAFDSDGSRLLARGVTIPPPSTAIGMMYSRGLFLIGIVVLPLVLTVPDIRPDAFVDIGPCESVLSESFDSFVDWRDSDARPSWAGDGTPPYAPDAVR